MSKRIYLSPPNMGGTEINYVNLAFDENWIAPLGPNVNGFESDLAEITTCGYAAALSSGTAAIHLALILSGVEKGDDVLASTFTFSASVNPIVYLGANPVFIDSEEQTWNMDPVLLEQAIRQGIEMGNKPKAVLLVHLYGMPAKMTEIVGICKKYDITLIEDAAEALGSKYQDKYLGTFGDFGIYSFNGNKILTTSGGGALVSPSSDKIKKARFLAEQARDEAPHYQHSQIGYNYRMSNVLAGIGRGQLEVLNKRVEQKRSVNQFYHKLLGAKNGITFLSEPTPEFFSNFWLTTILIDSKLAGFSVNDLTVALEKENIESRPLWKPMHLQPVFENYRSYLSGVSENLFECGLCLPSGSNMTNSDFDRIASVIKPFVR